MRRKLRRILARFATRIGPPDENDAAHFGILTYHRVAPADSAHGLPTWSVTPDQFERQLSGLLSRGFRPMPLTRMLEACRKEEQFPARFFAVTFDDGYENNLTYAAPILKRYAVPATIFLATQYLNTCVPFPFEDWFPARSRQVSSEYWRPLTRGQCLRLIEEGVVEFGSHTHSHRNLLGRAAELKADLNASLTFLREQLYLDSPSFSFPFGAVDADMTAVVRDSGVSCAVTTRERRVSRKDDPFAWGRFNVERDDDGETLTAKLDGRYTALCDRFRRWITLGINANTRMQRTSRSKPKPAMPTCTPDG